MRNPVPRIAAIHDMSGFGRTSLTVAIPILSCMGIQVCPMPTAVLSTHTVEFTDYTLCDLTPELGGILDHWERLGLHFDGVYSGFMASPEQMDSAARCIRNCLAPGGLAVVDPVLGDNGILDPTMTPEMVEKMRWLISCADRTKYLGHCLRTRRGPLLAHRLRIYPRPLPRHGGHVLQCAHGQPHSGRQPVHRIGSRRPVRHPRHPGHVRARAALARRHPAGAYPRQPVRARLDLQMPDHGRGRLL